MKFRQLNTGARFTVPHLPHLPMVKVEERKSDGTNSKPFLGTYNSVAVGGGRWVWEADQDVCLI